MVDPVDDVVDEDVDEHATVTIDNAVAKTRPAQNLKFIFIRNYPPRDLWEDSSQFTFFSVLITPRLTWVLKEPPISIKVVIQKLAIILHIVILSSVP